jgi:hypothetical protein
MPGAPPSVLKIMEGNYSGDAPVGKNKVEVFIYVEKPADPKYPGTFTKTNTVPPRFWGPESTLEATVTAAGPNEFKFAITSR